MNTVYKNEQTGRSMVEMLGVLAIIGVLSIGGISGYSKAMAKYRVNKTLDQISMLVMNIRSLFSASVDYKDLDNKLAIDMGIIPRDMLTATAGQIINAYQGSVHIGNPAGTTREFFVEYTGLTQEACVSLATADWGSQAGSGLVKISIGAGSGDKKITDDAAEPADKFEMTASSTTGEDGTVTTNDKTIPISLAAAAKSCSNSGDVGNIIRWTYY